MNSILVTGANGQLGNEIRKISLFYSHYNFIFTDVNELDITNSNDVDQFLKANPVSYVINCAAYTAVDKAETDKQNAYNLNAVAPLYLAEAATKFNARLIQVSTDYVFDGSANVPYTEEDAVNPESVYGRTKLEGEKVVQEYAPENSMIIRTSWLYSSFGNNFVKTVLRLGAEREKIGFVFDQVGTPTYANDLAMAIISIISNVENGTKFVPGIYHYSNEGVISWYDFAKAIAKIAILETTISPILSVEYPTPTKRPAFSVLNKNKIKKTYNIEIPYWLDSLEKCLALIK